MVLLSEAAGGDVAVGGGGVDVEAGGGAVGVLERVAGSGRSRCRRPGRRRRRRRRRPRCRRTGCAARPCRARPRRSGCRPCWVLISAGPPRRPTSTSPAMAVRRTLAASSILTAPYAPSKATSPSRPTPRNSALAAFASTREPAGSWTVTSMDPEGPRYLVLRRRGLDPQDAVAVVDRGLLRRLHVAALGGVGGQDLDRGVGPVGGDEPDASRRGCPGRRRSGRGCRTSASCSPSARCF